MQKKVNYFLLSFLIFTVLYKFFENGKMKEKEEKAKEKIGLEEGESYFSFLKRRYINVHTEMDE